MIMDESLISFSPPMHLLISQNSLLSDVFLDRLKAFIAKVVSNTIEGVEEDTAGPGQGRAKRHRTSSEKALANEAANSKKKKGSTAATTTTTTTTTGENAGSKPTNAEDLVRFFGFNNASTDSANLAIMRPRTMPQAAIQEAYSRSTRIGAGKEDPLGFHGNTAIPVSGSG